MSTIVHLSEDLADRLAAEAARRGVSVDELTAELLAAGLPAGEEVASTAVSWPQRSQ